MQGAVFRMAGSNKTCFCFTMGNCSKTIALYFSLVKIKMFSSGINFDNLEKVF